MAKSTPNDIFQYSLHSAYHAGLKDGGPPVAFLSNHGNHGIGHFDNDTDDDDDNNEEEEENDNDESDLILIDGVAYSIDKDGDASPADKDDQLPFAMVTIFQPTQRVRAPPSTTSKQLKAVFVDKSARNTPLPFRLRGSFKYINTQQQTFWDVRGTIFGFCVPEWQRAVSGEGLQCCFLSEEKDVGGRVVDLETGDDAVLEWAKCGRLHLGFPQDEEFEELRL